MSLITDRDLAAVEPSVFLDAASAGTRLLAATDGHVTGTALTSASSDFATLAIGAGHVIVFDGQVLEVDSRSSATALEVSRPRASSDDEKIAPSPGSDKAITITTFSRLIEHVQRGLLDALGVQDDDPRWPLDVEDIVNPQPLRRLLAVRTLERVFAAAHGLDPGDASLAARRDLYAALANEAAARTAVMLDTDGDGEPDDVRHLQVTVLRRV